jgi:hypothetical protein
MLSSGFAHLKPLPSQLVSRTLTRRVDRFSGELALELKRAPRPVCRNRLGLEPQQEPIGHDRDSHRAFHSPSLFGDRVLPQSHDALEVLHLQLHSPPAGR